MTKLRDVGIIIVLVAVLYGLMALFMPIIADLSTDAQATMDAEHDMTDYPGSSEAMGSAPWLLWFVPALIGGVVIVIRLRAEN